jgi:hypothetical protein
MKRLLILSVLLGVSYLAYYSYGQLNFGRRTASFFGVGRGAPIGRGAPVGEVRPGGEASPGGQVGPGGGPPNFGRGGRGRGRSGLEASGRGPVPEQATAGGELTPAQPGRGGPPVGGRPGPEGGPGRGSVGGGPGRGPGSNVSLAHVLQYTAILTFVAALTIVVDRSTRKARKPRRSV